MIGECEGEKKGLGVARESFTLRSSFGVQRESPPKKDVNDV